MNNDMFDKFMQQYFEMAVALKKRFQITEIKSWTGIIVASELSVQLGHYAYIVSGNGYVEEKKRNIFNVEDEISDILLQLCALCAKLNINKEAIHLQEYHFDSQEKAIIDMQVLIGQITETLMEIEKYRHDKPRYGYANKLDFICSRIEKMFSIVFTLGHFKNYNLLESFINMYKDASLFLDKYQEEHNV